MAKKRTKRQQEEFKAWLEKALETIRDKDQRQMYERCPECISDSCSKDKRCDQMPFSSIGDIAVAALDKGE